VNSLYFLGASAQLVRSLQTIERHQHSTLAIHFYGATEEEKAELERAAERDEQLEREGKIISSDEKGGIASELEVSPSRV
jgi:hypothetical protein